MNLPSHIINVKFALDRQQLAAIVARALRAGGTIVETREAVLSLAGATLTVVGLDGLQEGDPDSARHLALLTVNKLFPELRP